MCFMNTWEAEQAARTGAAVKLLRGKRAAQWLSDRTAELGLKMTRQTITDLENGRRRYVTTAEIIVLAKALETAPVTLIYPPPYDDSVEYLPGQEMSKFDAAQHFSGIFNASYDKVDGGYWMNTYQLRAQRETRDRRHTYLQQAEISIAIGDHDDARRYQAKVDELDKAAGDGR